VPAGATTGPVGVTTPGGQVSSAASFTVTVTPTITGFDPGSGAPGVTVSITGTNLNAATAVKFNGASAVFHVDSGVQITATVPPGATSGTLRVTTPGGTATSSGNFTVQ